MSETQTKAAFTAGQIAVWSWDVADDHLTIQAGAKGPLAELEGDWTLPRFLDEVEGLNRISLQRAVRDGDYGDVVDVHFTMRTGYSARLVGSFVDQGVARGLIVANSASLGSDIPRPQHLHAVYQPICRPVDGLIVGFEALARWRMPDGQLAGPDDLDEEGRAIDWTGVASFMLEKSLAVLTRLRASGRDVFMQINLSAVELDKPDLIRDIVAILRAAKPPAGSLRIELTEQAALRDSNLALGALSALKAAGADLILDDFGAGHSSLAWLAEIPAEGVKIDPKLVRLAGHKRGEIILRTLVSLMHTLELSVTAEGIENPEMAGFFAEIGCDYAQGYALGHPVEEDRLPDLLDSQKNPVCKKNISS